MLIGSHTSHRTCCGIIDMYCAAAVLSRQNVSLLHIKTRIIVKSKNIFLQEAHHKDTAHIHFKAGYLSAIIKSVPFKHTITDPHGRYLIVTGECIVFYIMVWVTTVIFLTSA